MEPLGKTSMTELRGELLELRTKLLANAQECLVVAEQSYEEALLCAGASVGCALPHFDDAARALLLDCEIVRDAARSFVEDARMIREILEQDDAAVWAFHTSMHTKRTEMFPS
jgi:hypothetical protein